MNIKQKIAELEEEYRNNGTNNLKHEIISTELRWMIRDYCDENGIGREI